MAIEKRSANRFNFNKAKTDKVFKSLLDFRSVEFKSSASLLTETFNPGRFPDCFPAASNIFSHRLLKLFPISITDSLFSTMFIFYLTELLSLC